MQRDLNTTAAPRPGEELDAARLAHYLNVPSLEIEQFPAGHSNLTYLVRCGTEEWVLRRPPFGSRVKSAHDMGREFRVLTPLHKVYPPAPKPIAYCEDESIIGAPFYLMERRRGQVIRRHLPDPYKSNPTLCRTLSESLVKNLATLHQLELQSSGLSSLGKPQGYIRRQIEGWTRRWEACKTESRPAMDATAQWLNETQPEESTAALIHNDYKLDNIILDSTNPAKIVALLDWEMATVGDPLMDLGSSLAYWTEPSDPEDLKEACFTPSAHKGFLTRSEFLSEYESQTQIPIKNSVFYYAYGLFKLAVILQQIYYRWIQGLTTDPRFSTLNARVAALSLQAQKSIESQSLNP